ncbi:MAG: hypothetical protein OXF88_16185, partial [Rhodobacteraceae bacterium]|nr:hypothetical protein [Paracoccaceae bacterium]
MNHHRLSLYFPQFLILIGYQFRNQLSSPHEPVRQFLGYHHCWTMQVSAGHRWKDRGVDNPKALKFMHPTIDVDDRGVVLAHLASCARMVLRSNVGVHPRAQVVIGHITQPGNNRFPPHVVPCHLLHKLVCVSGSRLIVEAEFEARLIEELSRV